MADLAHTLAPATESATTAAGRLRETARRNRGDMDGIIADVARRIRS